jgi:ribosomal protein L24
MTTTPSPIRLGSTVRVVSGLHRGNTGTVTGFDAHADHPFVVVLDGNTSPSRRYRFDAHELEVLVERTIGDQQPADQQPVVVRGVSSQAGLASIRGGLRLVGLDGASAEFDPETVLDQAEEVAR